MVKAKNGLTHKNCFCLGLYHQTAGQRGLSALPAEAFTALPSDPRLAPYAGPPAAHTA